MSSLSRCWIFKCKFELRLRGRKGPFLVVKFVVGMENQITVQDAFDFEKNLCQIVTLQFASKRILTFVFYIFVIFKCFHLFCDTIISYIIRVLSLLCTYLFSILVCMYFWVHTMDFWAPKDIFDLLSINSLRYSGLWSPLLLRSKQL